MVRKVLNNFYFRFTKCKVAMTEKINVRKKKNLVNKFVLTKEQKRAIDNLWIKNYGKKIPYNWHRLFASFTGDFDERYFPDLFLTADLINKFNPANRRLYLENKNMLQCYFHNLEGGRLAKNYVYNCSEYFYDEDKMLSYKEAIEKLYNLGEAIIKPTVDSDSGHNVNLLNIVNGVDTISGKKIEEILKKYGENWSIQEKIKPNKDFAKLNPSSINTIRLITYALDGTIYCTPSVLRIGRNGNFVDNAHAGGIAVGINKDGTLKKYAFTEFGEKFDVHPDTGIVFEGYKVPKMEEIIAFAKKYHYRIPHIGYIAWDLTLDEQDKIVIIEVNLNCPSVWLMQDSTGEAVFGDNTEKMIRMLKEKDKKVF